MRTRSSVPRWSAWLVLLTCTACGGAPAEDGGVDAGETLDAGAMLDAGTDAGRDAQLVEPSYVGEPCASDADCRGRIDRCLVDPIFGFVPVPHGYCTTDCAGDAECPDGSDCNVLEGICVASCGDTEGNQCPPGLGCEPILANFPDLPRHCFPGCEEDSDCGDGLVCAAGTGVVGTGLCIDPSRPLGGPCESDEDCPPEATCGAGPGGSCEIWYCDLEPESLCPDDARCVGNDTCRDGCQTDADCREGYECGETATDPGRLVCLEAFVVASLGQPCVTGAECPGGSCLSESGYGFPAGYCAAIGCDVAAQTGCPGDGVCIAQHTLVDGRTWTTCLDGCAIDADCRDGYACRPSRPADGASPRACMPACTSDDDCVASSPEHGDHVCNAGTGTCAPPFDPALLGEPCLGPGACPGGLCLDKLDHGWPGGACVLEGCRLSGAGPETPCPADAVCIDDGAGDPELGVCVAGCAAPADCRAGYACEAGGCVPSCGPSDCGPGYTCDTATGLCERS